MFKNRSEQSKLEVKTRTERSQNSSHEQTCFLLKNNIAGQVLTYKNPTQKIEKNSKNQSEIAACEQKTATEKPNFCSNTVSSLYFKIRAKKIHAAKPLAFSLHFLFRRDRNHYSNLTSKIMKMCEQILKKKTAPQYNSNSLNCKKTCRISLLLFES